MMELASGDKFSPVWQKLSEHFTTKLAELRAQNDGNLDPTTTAGLRGQIAVYKALLSLDKK